MTRELFGVDARERAKDVRLYRGEPGKLEGKRQDKLPNRHGGKHAVDQVRGLGGHSAARAAWA
jgi:hypothetical protein